LPAVRTSNNFTGKLFYELLKKSVELATGVDINWSFRALGPLDVHAFCN
jgi:hypothetical protein